jgi:hypothetical protein
MGTRNTLKGSPAAGDGSIAQHPSESPGDQPGPRDVQRVRQDEWGREAARCFFSVDSAAPGVAKSLAAYGLARLASLRPR